MPCCSQTLSADPSAAAIRSNVTRHRGHLLLGCTSSTQPASSKSSPGAANRRKLRLRRLSGARSSPSRYTRLAEKVTTPVLMLFAGFPHVAVFHKQNAGCGIEAMTVARPPWQAINTRPHPFNQAPAAYMQQSQPRTCGPRIKP